MAKQLDSFSITPIGDEYLIQVEDEDGETTEFNATFDQLDLIVEEIERHLNADEEDELVVDADSEEDGAADE